MGFDTAGQDQMSAGIDAPFRAIQILSEYDDVAAGDSDIVAANAAGCGDGTASDDQI